MKQIICTLIAIIALLGITACAKATAEEPNMYTKQVVYVHDWSEPKEPQGMVRIVKEQQERAAQQAKEQANEEYYEYSEPTYYAPSWDSADGFYSQGVRDGVGSETETYYSSRVAYHERTGEWHTDEEGYWRDADGYYIVSSDDYAPETVVQTSKGEGKVYDGGTESGNFDMYVDW